MFVETRKNLDKIAGPMPVIELEGEDLVPGILAGAGAAGQRKEIGAARHATGGAALHRAGADLLHRHDGEDRPEGLDLLLVDIAMRLDGHVAPGEPGAAGRQDHVDLAVGDPGAQLRGDLVAVVGTDRPRRQVVPGLGQPLHQRVAGAVLGKRAAVADGEHGDADGDELLGFVDTGHSGLPKTSQWQGAVTGRRGVSKILPKRRRDGSSAICAANASGAASRAAHESASLERSRANAACIARRACA